jgi:predicted outer membrane repeat protein
LPGDDHRPGFAPGSALRAGRGIGGFGGGIFSESSLGSPAVRVADSTLSGNSASVGGGAIFQDTFLGAGTVTITGSTLCGNTASEGGAIYNGLGMTLVVRGSSSSGNTAGDSGGGIYNLGMATLKHTTLSGMRPLLGPCKATGQERRLMASPSGR